MTGTITIQNAEKSEKSVSKVMTIEIFLARVGEGMPWTPLLTQPSRANSPSNYYLLKPMQDIAVETHFPDLSKIQM